MPLLIWGAIGIGGLLAGGYAADKVGAAAESSAGLLKWGAAAGAVYVGYRLAKSGGYLK